MPHLTPPLVTAFDNSRTHIIRFDKITAALCAIICAAGPGLGFSDTDIRARSLFAGGAMLFLLSCVNTGTTYLVVRWRSDKILSYLHTTANYFIL